MVAEAIYVLALCGRKLRETRSRVLDLYSAIHLLRKNYSPRDVESVLVLYDWDDDDVLHTVFLASFGHFPSPAEVGLDYVKLFREFPANDVVRLSKAGEIPADCYERKTPNVISRLNLEPEFASIHDWGVPAPGFYVGAASNFEDLVNYWNLRAADIDLVFYDPDLEDRLTGIRGNLLNRAQHWQESTCR